MSNKESEGRAFLRNVSRRAPEIEANIRKAINTGDNDQKASLREDAVSLGRAVSGALKNVYPDE